MSKREGILNDETAQGRLRKAQKQRDQLVGAAFKDVLSRPSGRLAMHYLIHALFGDEAVQMVTEPMARAMWDGRRWAGKLLGETLQQTDLDAWILMEAEGLERLREQVALDKESANAVEISKDD